MSKRLIIGVDVANDYVTDLIQDGDTKISNIIFNNAVKFSEELRELAKSHNIKVSSYELGWFPHYRIWHCDPFGFSSRSLLAQSRLDNVDIDIDKVSNVVDKYRQSWSAGEENFRLDKKYMVVVLQHTKDATIVHDYPGFTNWQDIIDYADSIRGKNQVMVIKINPQNVASKEKLLIPHNSVAVQSKSFNNDILSNAEFVVGVNSTMLYEASLLYDKPVIALGNSWFDSHPEVVQKVKIGDDVKIKKPTLKDIEYRRKMFFIMTKMQTPITVPSPSGDKMSSQMLCRKHVKASSITQIEEWCKDMPDLKAEWRP